MYHWSCGPPTPTCAPLTPTPLPPLVRGERESQEFPLPRHSPGERAG
jgi:hypothetical protein